MSAAAGSCAVVYLARGVDGGLASALRFLRSYDAHPAGAAHELIVAAKGWDGIDGLPALEGEAVARAGRVMRLPDDGFDFGAYRRVAAAIATDFVCFMNTHSEILAPGWLAKLLGAASRPTVGAAGATASWGTFAPTPAHYPFGLRRLRRSLPLPVFLMRAVALFTVMHPLRRWVIWRDWPAFPNPHLRSNAFLMRRALFLDFVESFAPPATKKQAFAMESGRRGLTRRLADQGLSVLVVDRDGAAFEPRDWPASRTFRVPGQAKLMVADNQTRGYLAAAAAMRRIMEVSAWGREFEEPPGSRDAASEGEAAGER